MPDVSTALLIAALPLAIVSGVCFARFAAAPRPRYARRPSPTLPGEWIAAASHPVASGPARRGGTAG